jgi:hypothetical protein
MIPPPPPPPLWPVPLWFGPVRGLGRERKEGGGGNFIINASSRQRLRLILLKTGFLARKGRFVFRILKTAVNAFQMNLNRCKNSYKLRKFPPEKFKTARTKSKYSRRIS